MVSCSFPSKHCTLSVDLTRMVVLHTNWVTAFVCSNWVTAFVCSNWVTTSVCVLIGSIPLCAVPFRCCILNLAIRVGA